MSVEVTVHLASLDCTFKSLKEKSEILIKFYIIITKTNNIISKENLEANLMSPKNKQMITLD